MSFLLNTVNLSFALVQKRINAFFIFIIALFLEAVVGVREIGNHLIRMG